MTPVAAGEIKEIELSNGSRILGEITSLEGDFYTIESMDLGTVRIEKSKVRAIRCFSMVKEGSSNLFKLDRE